jgi:hypothetical protein
MVNLMFVAEYYYFGFYFFNKFESYLCFAVNKVPCFG